MQSETRILLEKTRVPTRHRLRGMRLSRPARASNPVESGRKMGRGSVLPDALRLWAAHEETRAANDGPGLMSPVRPQAIEETDAGGVVVKSR
jgi:hypothetical protein